jgi:intron-binding protein aquarius
MDDQAGTALKENDVTHFHYDRLKQLQVLMFTDDKWKEDMEDFYLANVGSLQNPENIRDHFGKLSEIELQRLFRTLDIREKSIVSDEGHSKNDMLEILVYRYAKRISQIDLIQTLPVYPNEREFWDLNILGTEFWNGDHCLALPKLNLQFLTIRDYLLRNYKLMRLESTYEIRQVWKQRLKKFFLIA